MSESFSPANGGQGGPGRDDRPGDPRPPGPSYSDRGPSGQGYSGPDAGHAYHGQGYPDHEYYGPFGPSMSPSSHGPGFASQPSSWAPPFGHPASSGPPGSFSASTTGAPGGGATPLAGAGGSRRAPSALGLIAAVAATALVVGGGAGYGGSLLAGRTQSASPTVGSAPSAPVDPPASSSTAPSGAPLPPAPPQANTVEIAKRVLPATVMLQIGSSTGSGFVLDDSGRIMTNNHVVAGASDGGRIRVVLADGRRLSATLVGRSPSYDIAVVKVQPTTRLPVLPVGNSDDTLVGQPVVAVGSPLGLPGTVTQGIVSAQDRPVVVTGGAAADAPTAYINAIQTDAPINPGNSGGPLVDAAGRVIGVNSAILTLGNAQGQNGSIGLGFAIPANQAIQIGQQLIKNGKARYPVIGATVTDKGSASGAEISAVEQGGPADDAGLRPSDLVSRIDDKTVTTMEELIVNIRTRRPGETVKLDYTRGSARRTASVVLGSKEG